MSNPVKHPILVASHVAADNNEICLLLMSKLDEIPKMQRFGSASFSLMFANGSRVSFRTSYNSVENMRGVHVAHCLFYNPYSHPHRQDWLVEFMRCKKPGGTITYFEDNP